MLQLEKINAELNSTLEGLHDFMPQLGFMDQSTALKNQCDETAAQLIEQSQRIVESEQMKTLVSKLTSLMLQINKYAENDLGSYELSSLDNTMKSIKKSLNQKNIPFEDKVETSIAYIKNGLQEGGNMLDAFSNNGSKKSKHKPMEINKQINISSTDEEEEEEEEEEEIDNDEPFEL